MKILHILNDIREIGNGIINVAIDLACLQAELGHAVGVISAGGEFEMLLQSKNIKHFKLDQSRKPINLIRAAVSYRKIISDFQPDIVHAHMMTGIVLARCFRNKASYALISTVHNEFQRSAIIMSLADDVIAVSKAVSQLLQQRGISKKKLHVVTNGTLGSPRTRPLSEYQPLPLERPAIVTVAGMYKRKGIAELIDAFCKVASSFPTVHLYLVGNGPDKVSFEANAYNSQFPDRIHFEGFQREPQKYLLSTDIFVLASHKDPSPLVIPEAREAGCAIVATNVDGIPEALEQGKAGILVPPFDSNALAEVLTKLLQDPKSLSYWSEQSQINIKWLNSQRVCEQNLDVYEKSIQKRKSYAK